MPSSPDITRLVFGLVTALPEREASAPFDALAAWMLAHTGVEVERKTAPSYQELAASMREGTSDVAWLPPVAYAWLAEAVNPVGSIVREGRTSYSSALVVAEDSKLEALADLRETRAGWVDPWSAAGFVVPRLELARAGMDPQATFKTETFYGNHRDALLALMKGACDVSATFARTPEDGEPTTEGGWSKLEDVRVRVLATFGPIPTDVIVVRRNLAPTSYERILAAFREACSDAAARPLVRAVFGGDELREGIEPGHDSLRRAYERAMANGLFD
jgi:phosphate/phosphite/phosphonate ABC transporter binding protein